MKNNSNFGKKASRSGAFFPRVIDISLQIILAGFVILFIVYPLVCIVIQSFGGAEGFTLEQYKNMLDNTRLLKNSLYTAILSAFFSTVLALAISVSVYFSHTVVKRILTGILMISMVSPPFIASLAYIQLFGRNGLITRQMLGLSLDPYGPVGVIVMQVLFFSALNALLLLSMLERFDENMIQASADLGAPSWYTFLRIVCPLLRPTLIICFLLSFIRSMADFGTPIVIGGRFETVATEIYMQIIGYADLEKSSALNVFLLVPTVIAFVLYMLLMKKNQQIFSTSAGAKAERKFRVKGLTGLILYGASAFFFGMMILEYGAIFLNSVTKNIRGHLTFTLEYFQAFQERSMDSFIRSIIYALIVGLAGTLTGVLISYYVEWRKVRLGAVAELLVTLPYMLPGSCFGIGYILAFHDDPLKLTGTAAIVVLNMIFKQLSITTKATAASMMQINRNIDHAARDLGAHPMQVLKDILLPNLRPAFASGFINNFTTAMTTAGAVIFLVTPGQKIAVFTLFDCINTGRYGEASMISTVIIIITVLVNAIFAGGMLNGKGVRNVPRNKKSQ